MRGPRRDEIVRIASEAFLDAGYAGTAMSTAASRVGGSKATLYNYFPSKEELFAACVLESYSSAALEAASNSPIPGEADEKRLQRMGESLLLRISAGRSVDYFRVIGAEVSGRRNWPRSSIEPRSPQTWTGLRMFLRTPHAAEGW